MIKELRRTYKYHIKKSNKNYSIYDDLCFKSKNLYNSALYELRNQFFTMKENEDNGLYFLKSYSGNMI